MRWDVAVEAPNLRNERPHLPQSVEVIGRAKNEVESSERRMYSHKPAVPRRDLAGGEVFVQ